MSERVVALQARAILPCMCLLVLAHRAHPELPIVLAANRDELYARPTEPLRVWPEEPDICAGRDLAQGGTWLGISRRGRFAALTNFRRGAAHAGTRSRGDVVLDYLRSSHSPEHYVAQLASYADQFGGFSVIVGDLEHEPYYFSNRGDVAQRLAPGLYGLSNEHLDVPWPKVTLAKQRIGALLARENISSERLADAMDDRSHPPDATLPDTGIGVERERVLAPMFVAGEHYGTRAVTAVLIDARGRALLHERSYGPHGHYLSEARCELELIPPAPG
jgi:uncharacterized protein with NRDE domain